MLSQEISIPPIVSKEPQGDDPAERKLVLSTSTSRARPSTLNVLRLDAPIYKA
jgi:hypothetical protein